MSNLTTKTSQHLTSAFLGQQLYSSHVVRAKRKPPVKDRGRVRIVSWRDVFIATMGLPHRYNTGVAQSLPFALPQRGVPYAVEGSYLVYMMVSRFISGTGMVLAV